MNKLIDNLVISDGLNEFQTVPEWARFYFDIGYQIGQMQLHQDMFLRLVVVTPISDYVATFIAFGKLIAQTTAPFDVLAHIASLRRCPDGTRLVRIFNHGQQWKKQRVIKKNSADAEYISFEYKDQASPQTSIFPINAPGIVDIFPVYVDDKAVNTHKLPINERIDVLTNPAFASHYSRLLNPQQAYSAIVGSIAQQKAEQSLSCQLDTLEFKLDELFNTTGSTLLQPNTLLLSGQIRSEIEAIKSDLVIFTGGSGIVNHAYALNNKHHVYVLDYQDSSLAEVLALIQTQYFNRCDYQPEIQNTRLFKPVETTAFCVWG